MKKILFVAGLTLMGLPVFAQNSDIQAPSRNRVVMEKVHKKNFNPEKVADVKTERLDKIVKLDEGQKQKVREIYLQQAREHQARATLRQETRDQVNAVLNEEQKALLSEYKKKKTEAIKHRKVKRDNVNLAPARANLQLNE